jgi:hypothetical protein
VINQFGHLKNLAVDTLQRYRMTLEDNSYLTNQNYRLQTVKFHRDKEKELNKPTTFAQLWPKLVQQL